MKWVFKKAISVLLIFTLMFCTSLVSYGMSDNSTLKVELKGFSYDITGNQMDESDDYSVNLSYTKLENGNILLNLPKIEGVTKEAKSVELDHIENQLYGTNSSSGFYINFELKEQEAPLLDIIINDRVYAFGVNRRLPVKREIQKLKMDAQTIEEMNHQVANVTPKAIEATGGVELFSKGSGAVNIKAYYVPAGTKYKESDGTTTTITATKVYLRVNTKGSGIGQSVRGMKITGGKIPSPYEIVSMTPHESNDSNNFVDTLVYLIGLTPYIVGLPSFSYNSSGSSWGINTFSYAISGINASWKSLSSIENTPEGSGTKANAMMFFLTLDRKTGAYPTPSGTVRINYFASGAGTFDTSPYKF